MILKENFLSLINLRELKSNGQELISILETDLKEKTNRCIYHHEVHYISLRWVPVWNLTGGLALMETSSLIITLD